MSPTNMMSFVYNPDNQTDEELRDRFVIRTQEFKRLLADISDTDLAHSPQHYLIIGQRGTGKTSLLLRLKSEIQQRADLTPLLAVQFAEEQYGIFDLCGLWEKVAEALEDTAGFTDLLTQLEQQAAHSDYAQNCFALLEHYLIQHQKRLVLFIDNVGDLLDKFSLTEQQRLRDIFHNSNYIQLIAASAKVLEHSYQHDSPFFEFFKTIQLSGLNKADTYTLLRKLAEVHGVSPQIETIISQQAYRVESVRRLTGGVPRTIVLLFEIFMDDSGNVFADLETILDRVTPLYKHRMDDLPTQQQVIVNTLALNWDGMTSKELSNKINNPDFSSKKISSQLQLLQKNGLVIAKPIDKKNNIYLLQERFFNIWYLMRFGRKKNKQNVIWLINFLKDWCSNEDLETRARQHIEAAKMGKLHPNSYLMAESLAQLITDKDLQHNLIVETRKALAEIIKDIDNKLSPSDKETWDKAIDAYNSNNFLKALKSWQKLTEKDDRNAMFNLGVLYQDELKDYQQAITYYKMAVDKGNSHAMNNLGFLYQNELKDYQQAITYYKMAVDKDHSMAMNNLGFLYKNQLKDYQQAITYYKIAIDKDDSDAMNNLGLLYDEKLKDYQQAITYYQMAVDKGNSNAMFNLGNLYKNQLKDYQQAITYYKMAVDKGDSDAMNNLGFLYQNELKDYQQAIVYYKMAVDKDDSRAMNNLGVLYQNELKDYQQATIYYKMAVDKGDSNAMFNLGFLYQNKLKDYQQAITYYQMAIDKNDSDAMNALAWLYYEKNIESSESLALAQQAYTQNQHPTIIHTLATVLLWHNQILDSIEKAKDFLKHSDFYLDYLEDIADYFILLLAKDQAEAAYQLFRETPDLAQQIKPIYYATLTLLKDQYPKEYLKMGEELKETVDEVLLKVKAKAERYNAPNTNA